MTYTLNEERTEWLFNFILDMYRSDFYKAKKDEKTKVTRKYAYWWLDFLEEAWKEYKPIAHEMYVEYGRTDDGDLDIFPDLEYIKLIEDTIDLFKETLTTSTNDELLTTVHETMPL